MTRKCTRCGTEFTARTVDEHRCRECEVAVRTVVAADALRHRDRFSRGKVLSW